MASGGLVSEPLNPQRHLLWQFLVELLLCCVLTIFFLFYFNRLFATLVSYGIRAYTWHNYRAYIDIQSLQISLLGGRLFWKDIRYHGHNQTILVHGGHITWRFWFRKVKETELFSGGQATRKPRDLDAVSSDSQSRDGDRNLEGEESGGKQKTKEQPCRISIKVSGVEVFLYNRSPAYDGIIENFARAMDDNEAKKSPSQDDQSSRQSSGPTFTDKIQSVLHRRNTSSTNGSGNHSGASAGEKPRTNSQASGTPQAPEIPSFLRMFPIRIDCNKGAIAVGNESTPAIITVKFDKASGELSAAHAGPLDAYKQLFNFEFEHPVVQMKPNPDYKAPQLATAARLRQEAMDNLGSRMEKEQKRARKQRFWHPLQSLSTLFSKSADSLADSRKPPTKNRGSTVQPPFPGQERWQGLTRYLDDEDHDEHDEWGGVEYAKFSLIADVPKISMSFYWDVPGPVPKIPEIINRQTTKTTIDINGSLPPDYGLDLQIHGGIINYGPWADRHRVIIQNYFFPANCTDSIPAEPLNPGDIRVSTVLKLFITFEDDVVLRIPIREKSKDWRWKGRAQNVTGEGKNGSDAGNGREKKRKTGRFRKRDAGVSAQNARPFGWLDIKLQPNSTVNYVMDMVAGPHGYHNSLDLDIRGAEIASSVNHGLLWRSSTLELDANLSNPLKWNGLREWAFNIRCRDLELFLLRDHMFLLTDLVGDWGSGPPPDYYTFTPFRYILNMDFRDLKVFLNTNDSNIINNPADLEDNHFLILGGQKLGARMEIPLDQFRPARSEINFSAQGKHIDLELSVPPRNTAATFVKEKQVARLGEVTLLGSYKYFAETRPGLTDRLTLDIRGSKLILTLYGFLIRHFLKIKDNYFGEDMHFKTLEEYQETPQSKGGETQGVDLADVASNKSNDLDVILSIGADEASVLLPANLYTAEDHLRLDLPFAAADLRFTSYYMDLMVDFSPLSVSLALHANEGTNLDNSGRTQLFIDLVKIYGHRTFGLPPVEPTYVCSWDFDVGKISGECSGKLLEKIAAFARCFSFSLDDEENALPLAQPVVIHDMTFLRLKTDAIKIWLHVAQEALLLSADPISLDFNDWAGPAFSQRLNLLIPNFVIACVDANAATRHKRGSTRRVVDTHAYLQTDVRLTMLKRNLEFTEDRRQQQCHLKESDLRTHRTPWLLHDGLEGVDVHPGPNTRVDTPAMPYPQLPHPVKGKSWPRSYSLSSASIAGSHTTSGSSGTSIYRDSPTRLPNETRTLRSMASKGSLRESVRRVAGKRPSLDLRATDRSAMSSRPSLAETRSTSFYSGTLSGEESRERGTHPRASIAQTSSLETPYFPLDTVQFDVSGVPTLRPDVAPWESSPNAIVFNDVSTKTMDENFVHTSFLLSFEPGIRALFTPKAVGTVVNILDMLQPKHPRDILDDFQIDIMTKILSHQRRVEGHGTSTELSFKLPAFHFRFVNSFQSTTGDKGYCGKDQYDLILDRLSVALRDKTYPAPAKEKSSLAVHTTLKSLNISVKEDHPNATDQDVAVQIVLSDLLVWLVTGKAASVNVSFRNLDIANSSRKIQYLASLIHRTTLLADDLEAKFTDLSAKSQRRLRYLAYMLTVSGKEIPDPAFITRPSYVLRAATNHLRNQDSWKIVSRVHYVYDNLPERSKNRINNECIDGFTSCPADAETKVIKTWDQWRTWDLAHVQSSVVMRTLYGNVADVGPPEKPPMPVDVSIRTAAIRLMVDPGPEQSEIFFQLLVIKIALTPAPALSGLMLLENEHLTKHTVVEVSTKNVAVKFSWEICELLENVLRLFQSEAPHLNQKPSKAVTEASEIPDKNTEIHDFQILFGTDHGSISLDTINLRHVSSSRRLNLSVVGSDRSAAKEGMSVSALLHSALAGTELSSRGRTLMKSQLVRPNIFISHDDENWKPPMPEAWMVVGKCEEMSIKVTEDILYMIEVANSVICDEVAYLHRQKESFKMPKHAQTVESTSSKEEAQLPNITIALLMDAYRVDITLLQSLSYIIQGEMGRLSATPVFGGNKALNVNFDVDKHTHYFRGHSGEKSHTIAAFNVPLHNGCLQLLHSPTGLKVMFNSIMETFVIDASAVHGLLTTVNEPEVQNILKSIKDDVGILKSNIKEAMPSSGEELPVKQIESQSQPVVFDANFVMAGLSVIAKAPGKYPDSPKAKLLFELASIKAKATNLSEEDGSLLPLPEFAAFLPAIKLSLESSEGDGWKQCGNLLFGIEFRGTFQNSKMNIPRRDYRIRSSELEVNIFADTASAVVEVLNHLQERIRDIDFSRERRYLRKLREPRRRGSRLTIGNDGVIGDTASVASSGLFTSAASLVLLNIQISWIVGNSVAPHPGRESEDLVLSFKRIDLSTRSEEAARLTIENMQLQMVPSSQDKLQRSLNSALLPEVVFNVSYASTKTDRRFAFQAAGKSLDLRLESRFILPAFILQRSISLAGQKFRAASASWKTEPTSSGAPRKNLFGKKKLSSLVVDADFAGAVVTLQGKREVVKDQRRLGSTGSARMPLHGRYGQFANDGSNTSTTLRAPGVSTKIEYNDDEVDPSLNAEVKVDASSNILYPMVVPLVMDVSNSIKEVVQDKDEPQKPVERKRSKSIRASLPPQKGMEEDSLITADPSAILGKTRLNMGLRICKQEFSLSCQPIARVAATARFEDIYLTVNSIKSTEQGHFFAVSSTFDKLQASVQHVYSRESTFSCEVDNIILSVMNSKHLSGTSGMSAILKINPTRTQINVRQLQDFLLFREIWIPPEVREVSKPPSPEPDEGPQEYLVQRYQQVAAAAAFPWNATIAVAEISVDLDMGQAIGKPSFKIVNLWASSKKNSDWEQNLCIGVESIGITSTGRTSGFVDLTGFNVRTSISWPPNQDGKHRTPLIQATLGFNQLCVKAAFDYQTFAVADITSFAFLMYNVRATEEGARDRLVAMLEGDKVQAFLTPISTAQAVALMQAIERLIQENQSAYKQSLKDIEKFLRRSPNTQLSRPGQEPSPSPSPAPKPVAKSKELQTPISLHTDVVVTLKAISFGAFPGTFSDNQVLLLTASDVQARFAVALEKQKIHSGLGMTLGQLSVALASVAHPKGPKTVSELTVEEVVSNANSARGGTILRVPKVIAAMQTWQAPNSNQIDYIFKSSFEGKVDVGWNYSRISFIRNMWDVHSRALANRLGKPLPESAVKITAGPEPGSEPQKEQPSSSTAAAAAMAEDVPPEERGKITAVVNVPQSKYEYTALEAPIIETPQLRDMGEATPPLEWIGLHRDRLPNVTHQIVIVTLLEVVKEVEDAYSRILGST
ncbi:uncharacterized protein K452DRAFT_138538 [Aplosporella prunicola CBS 121167]|uniref:ETS domain-containing protein n=1 Tax=Aplosporella prunicola CBS 121167 TaxID=1176127 RepID=A0A6A6AWD6_9PEZI|nr:uncharacterized protein K452DRAFT_138538 [Aplosporella prunicola CBS 121167]KAF2136312.1 hypothetical protein K452DRAFT_138538 [Aplosporella prunicola CBS 121167]